MSLSKINGNHSSQSNYYYKYEKFHAKQVNLINEKRSVREFLFLNTSIFFLYKLSVQMSIFEAINIYEFKLIFIL